MQPKDKEKQNGSMKERCIYCLDYFDEVTDDHLFPSSWYPTSTPEEVQRVTVPGCKKCNHDYGKIEEELRLRIGLAANPENEGSKGVLDKVLRSMDSSQGRNSKDAKIRGQKKDRISNAAIPISEEIEKGVLPSLDPPHFKEGEEKIGMPVNAKMLDTFCEKIVRGIVYHESGECIEKTHEIKTLFLKEEKGNPADQALDTKGKEYDFGPGLKVRRVAANDDRVASVCEITIWGQFKIRALVLPKRRTQARE